MPKKFADAWEAYDEKWKRLMSQAQTGTRTPLTFATVPWPVLNPPTSPEAITRNTVGAFVLSQWHSSGKNNRDRIREALMRWHPDRFESRFLVWVPEGDERDHVKQGVGNVTRSLNELLARESSSGAL
ncbi:hypothetical protein CPB86DRAFT_720818 [Serendipita vermifera]|nr:hypothetical protein CPB86DRAFT_720818 [Serendipita vermifera]